jgi:hypothetical protein
VSFIFFHEFEADAMAADPDDFSRYLDFTVTVSEGDVKDDSLAHGKDFVGLDEEAAVADILADGPVITILHGKADISLEILADLVAVPQAEFLCGLLFQFVQQIKPLFIIHGEDNFHKPENDIVAVGIFIIFSHVVIPHSCNIKVV